MEEIVYILGTLTGLPLIYLLYRVIFFKSIYGKIEVENGIVIEMDYIPSSGTYDIITNSYYYTLEKNEVWIETKSLEKHLDSDELYQRVCIADDIKVTFQKEYTIPRFWYGLPEFSDYRIIKIECPKNLVVDFNESKLVDENL